jgi:hypothetical protein
LTERGLICFLMMARCDRLFREAALPILSDNESGVGAGTSARRNRRSAGNLDSQAFAVGLDGYLRQ